MSKQAFSLTGWPPPATASTDLTNDYATSLGTKLDNGFALAGGSHQCNAGLLRAPLGDVAYGTDSPVFLP